MTVNNCPAGDFCQYNSTYNTLLLAVSPVIVPLLLLYGAAREVYNNTDPLYSSEGNYVLEIPGVLCAYVPDTNDEQAPDSGEAINAQGDGVTVTVAQFGSTAAAADATTIALLSDCA
ncbi:hypothetical protein ACFZB9_19355 [Kitasatospora sp. NPDC008050]|uniref:hypothetical protein n=1 Tax=Kitasatospora sp. NPDC008050 TaxID=3364021 RepID=UPI0036E597FE